MSLLEAGSHVSIWNPGSVYIFVYVDIYIVLFACGWLLCFLLAGIMFNMKLQVAVGLKMCIDGLVQDCSNSIANASELLQSCTKASIWLLFLWKTLEYLLGYWFDCA